MTSANNHKTGALPTIPSVFVWCAFLWLAIPAVNAQSANGLESMLTEPFPLVPAALGSYSFPVSTGNPEAQAYFDQGIQLMFAYGKYEAVRSFREAQKRDPE